MALAAHVATMHIVNYKLVADTFVVVCDFVFHRARAGT